MRLHRPGVRTRLRAGARRLREAPHWLELRRLGRSRPLEYRDYLATQLKRTLSKSETDPGAGAVRLIDEVVEAARGGGSVLCIGCRNTLELDRFHARGFEHVVGIDLFSQREDILVMDMHDMSFEDDAFDVVYASPSLENSYTVERAASPSLEHSYDVERVAHEIVRVGRQEAVVGVEVPVRTQQSAADRVVFSGLEELRGVFAAHVGDELLGEEAAPHTPTNEQGTDVARLVFRLRK